MYIDSCVYNPLSSWAKEYKDDTKHDLTQLGCEIMAIIALIIALFAAAFTGYHVYLAFNEQKQRLRPHVYIGKQNA